VGVGIRIVTQIRRDGRGERESPRKARFVAALPGFLPGSSPAPESRGWPYGGPAAAMVASSGGYLKGFDVELPEEVVKRARELEFGEELLEWLGRSKAFRESVERVIDEFPRWRSVVVDLSELDADAAMWVARHSEEVEELVREVAVALVEPYRPEVDGGQLVVEFRESPLEVEVDDVGIRFTDQLVTVEGIVRRVVERKARVEWAVYKCPRCKRTFRSTRDDLDRVRCPRCGREGIPEEIRLFDCRRIVLQELPEEAGDQPRTLEVLLPDELSYRDVRPGDRVRITGRPRVCLTGVPRPDDEFEFSLEACGIRRLSDPRPELELSREELEEILEMAESDPLERVTELIAPHLYGLGTIKRATGLQLFSCVPERGRARERVHILIVGDPATAKTQLLQYVAEELAPKGVYVSAQHVTGPGLTAAAVHTEEGWVLEAGPAVLADGGLLAIDELDKASKDDLNAMLEAMESGKVSVAKAGITATLNARCAVLAAANPEAGRWQGDHPIEEINLDPALLSRFDLILPTHDRPEPERDERILEAMASAHEEEPERAEERELLRKYVAHAVQHYDRVKMTDEALEIIKEWYLGWRERCADLLDRGEIRTVPVTRRQAGAALRLARAHARMRLSEEVEEEDARVATELMDHYIKNVLKDPDTGEPDADTLETGSVKSRREARRLVLRTLRRLAEEHPNGVPKRELVKKLKHRIPRELLEEALRELKRESRVVTPRPECYLPAE